MSAHLGVVADLGFFPEIVWIVACVAVAAFAQSLSGFGFALIAVPLMAVVLEPRVAVVVATMVGAVSTIVQAWADRRHAVRDVSMRLTAAAFLGMPIGSVLFLVVSADTLRLLVGIAVLAAAVLLVRGFRLDAPSGRLDWVMGAVSGVLATSTSTNGPPLVFVLQARGMAPDSFRATINTVFALSNIGALAFFIGAGKVNADGLVGFAVALPAMLVAMRLGYAVRPHVEGQRFRRLVLALLTLAGVSAILASVAS
ncbi:MAG: sulfite exporter TauE/SafE family protein [Actinomycetota bacterium]